MITENDGLRGEAQPCKCVRQSNVERDGRKESRDGARMVRSAVGWLAGGFLHGRSRHLRAWCVDARPPRLTDRRLQLHRAWPRTGVFPARLELPRRDLNNHARAKVRARSRCAIGAPCRSAARTRAWNEP